MSVPETQMVRHATKGPMVSAGRGKDDLVTQAMIINTSSMRKLRILIFAMIRRMRIKVAIATAAHMPLSRASPEGLVMLEPITTGRDPRRWWSSFDRTDATTQVYLFYRGTNLLPTRIRHQGNYTFRVALARMAADWADSCMAGILDPWRR